LRLRNDSGRTRRISATYYLGWVLGEHREETQPHIVTDWDETAGAILATNSYREQGADLVAFAAMDPAATSYSGDRTAFIGRNGDLGQPAALTQTNLPNRVGGVLDPCAALQSAIELEPGGQAEFIFLLGEAESEAAARNLVAKYRENLAVELALESTRRWWDQLLDGIHVQTPELSADFLINRWLLYQTLSCRLWGRTALYQSGGAFGFRDQLQDGLALLHQQPELARRQILRAAGRQFEEGDVQHWWHPAGGGIRSRISDDMLWLPYCVARYVEVTGDTAILEEQAPFLQGRPLQPDEAEAYLTPTVTSQTASLWEHCRRAVARGLTHGPHGLPLIGAGDWNDGLNRIGIEGKGESVWLGWFLISVLKGMADLAGLRGESGEQAAYLEQAGTLARRIEQVAWDGAWYLRAFTDQGVPLGSSASEEGWIDSLPQSWAWLSGQADEERATRAFESAQRHLVRPNEGLVLLFTPPFDRLEPSPGYIRAYPPGVRENGGQYTHAAIWLAMAAARAHRGDEAVELLRLINPIEHAKDAAGVGRYQLEPYVLAGDVYRLTGRIGQGGWSWYTGSAGWMYQAWVDEVLGLKRRGTRLRIDPVIPAWWDGFTVRYRHGEAVYWIEVRNPDSVSTGLAWVEVDGQRVEDGWIQLDPGPVKHRVMVRMGKGADGSSP
jgi:cyclic beta-1,2-glucan synthetase